MSQIFLVSWAQNCTAVHELFLAALKTYRKERGAEMLFMRGKYRNATAVEEHGDDEWWVDEVVPYLVGEQRLSLAPKLNFFADLPIQPTATDPLSGLEILASTSSAIVGHARRALRCIATSRSPKVLWTSGAVTIPNYTRSKAGKKAEPHHVIGALVVEVADDGLFFVRHLTWDDALGGFVDLDRLYTPRGVKKAPRAASLTIGDLHDGSTDESAYEASREQAELLRPHHIATHDTLDFSARSHHRRGWRDRYDARNASVESEVRSAGARLAKIARWRTGGHDVWEIDSNHDSHLDRWLDEHDRYRDPHNDRYYCELRARAYAYREVHGNWPNAFALEARRLANFPTSVHFADSDEPLIFGGVEHRFHGHEGTNGARGSLISFSKLGCKTNTAHKHEPGIRGGAWCVGTTSKLRMGYNRGPSSWAHANIITHETSKRQMFFSIAGRWRLV